jgi:hypothetical protein
MIVPVEEQIAACSAEEAGATQPQGQGPAPIREPSAEEGKPEETPQARGTLNDDPQGTEEAKEELAQKVRHKMIKSWKKLGKQMLTIVVTVPKEKEEIKDIEKA